MASIDPFLTRPVPEMTVKKLAESGGFTSTIPSSYAFALDPHHHNHQLHQVDPIEDHHHQSIPIIDFSLLTSGNPHQRSKIVHDLGRACEDWGFFMVINHGVPEYLMKGIIDACRCFFNLTEEEKVEFKGKHVLDPIRCGTSFNSSVDTVLFWRDYLKVFVHPQFHFPDKPPRFSEISFEYCKRAREVARELLRGISESLGLDSNHIDKSMNLESGFQVFISNLYPPCPQPDLAMGMPPHSDHGLLTLLAQNGVPGLQILRRGKWIDVGAPPDAFLVNTGDHLEILSNGKYKSVMHRATVNKKSTRISIAIANGPSLDTVVSPATEFVDGDHPSRFQGIRYEKYMELQQSNHLDGKSCLDRIRLD